MPCLLRDHPAMTGVSGSVYDWIQSQPSAVRLLVIDDDSAQALPALESMEGVVRALDALLAERRAHAHAKCGDARSRASNAACTCLMVVTGAAARLECVSDVGVHLELAIEIALDQRVHVGSRLPTAKRRAHPPTEGSWRGGPGMAVNMGAGGAGHGHGHGGR